MILVLMSVTGLNTNNICLLIIVNEQIRIMGQTVLRTFLRNLNETSPSWFAVFADEETDVAIESSSICQLDG